MIGHDFRKYLPLLIALFSFILVNNLWGIFPFTLLPTASHVGWAYGLALHGLGPLQRRSASPSTASAATSSTPRCRPGCRWFMWPLIIPLEFFSNIIVRPITLSLRLFANMFAGHLLVLVFVLGGEYLLLHSDSIVNKIAGGVALDLQHGDLRPGDLRAVACRPSSSPC